MALPRPKRPVPGFAQAVGEYLDAGERSAQTKKHLLRLINATATCHATRLIR
jgi:hypothetical protein